MRHWRQGVSFSRNRKVRWEKRLRQLAQMRAAKERKRLANPVESEPRMEKFWPLEIGLRDKLTGEVAWVEFRSMRDAVRRLAMVRKHYAPGIHSSRRKPFTSSTLVE